MRWLPWLLALAPGLASAGTGYVYEGDLNGDGVPDAIRSGPAEQFGNAGGPFLVSLSDGRGGFLQRVIGLHPEAVALDAVPGKPRLWSYARASCCAGTLSVTTLDAAFETRSIPLEFGDDPGAPGVGRDLNRGIFEGSHRIRFVQVTDYQPPLPPGGEWGK